MGSRGVSWEGAAHPSEAIGSKVASLTSTASIIFVVCRSTRAHMAEAAPCPQEIPLGVHRLFPQPPAGSVDPGVTAFWAVQQGESCRTQSASDSVGAWAFAGRCSSTVALRYAQLVSVAHNNWHNHTTATRLFGVDFMLLVFAVFHNLNFLFPRCRENQQVRVATVA